MNCWCNRWISKAKSKEMRVTFDCPEHGRITLDARPMNGYGKSTEDAVRIVSHQIQKLLLILGEKS